VVSPDTNILFHACHAGSVLHASAQSFLCSHADDDQFAVCELVLVELYGLVRNPAVVERPLSPKQAVDICQEFRRNRRWLVIDYPGGPMAEIWQRASAQDFARRRIYDVRLALTLRQCGVTEFATRNTRDFQDCGFARVWDPLSPGG
jgi:toxin-antitoxin system PIN domain toxin